MKKRSISILPVLALLSACSGGGSSSGSLPQTPAVAPGPASAAIAPNEAQSDAAQQAQPLSVPVSSDLLYVGNTQNNSITVYHHDAHGNTGPLYVIAGSNTGINSPGQLSEDAAGNLYVANGGINSPASILVFAHGANGDVTPMRTLAGPATGMHHVVAMTVDKTTGKIFAVDDSVPAGEGANLLRFPPNAAGNQAPFARGTISFWGSELASDSTGKNIIEAHVPTCCHASSAGIQTIVKQFPNNASLNPIFDISAQFDNGVADDPSTKTYLATTPAGIERLAENTAGYGPNFGVAPSFAPAIGGTITSDTCGTQIVLGYLRNIYVAHGTQSGCAADAVYVYTHDSTGNAAPLRVLSGPATGLRGPYGIYEGK
jgi:hypothetical protein